MSTKADIVVPVAKRFLQEARVEPEKLVHFTNAGFDVTFVPAADCHYYIACENAFIICGFIRHPQFVWDWEGTNTPFFEQLIADLQSLDASALRAAYTGSFTIFFFNSKELVVFNTLSGLQPVYYHTAGTVTTICSSIVCMQQLVQEPVRDACVIQMALNEWMESYTRRTLLKNVYRLFASEKIVFAAGGRFNRQVIPFSVTYKPDDAGLMDCVKEVWEGYKDIGRQFAGKNLEATMSLSGGVDSRTAFAAIYKYAKKLVAVHHGGEDFYEYLRAKEVADAFGVPIHLVPSADKMFPEKGELDTYFLHDGSVVVEYLAITEKMKQLHLPEKMVMGDLFEAFKVDGTSIWDGRANKQKTTLHLMFGGKPHMTTIEEYGFDNWLSDRVEYFLKKMEKNAPLLSKAMKGKWDSPEIQQEIRADMADWLNDLKHFGLKYLEDHNEVSNWLSKGRASMWLQSSSGSGFSTGFSLFCTDKNLATILSVPLKHKLRQKLHFYMFRLPDFKHVNKIPTPQIPYTAVTAPLPWKELVMYLRLKADKVIIKKTAQKKPHEKTRVVKGPNYFVEYNEKNLQRYLSWYNDVCISKEAMKQLFQDIQQDKLQAVSTIDYIGLAKSEFIIATCKKLVAAPVTA